MPDVGTTGSVDAFWHRDLPYNHLNRVPEIFTKYKMNGIGRSRIELSLAKSEEFQIWRAQKLHEAHEKISLASNYTFDKICRFRQSSFQSLCRIRKAKDMRYQWLKLHLAIFD